MGSGSERAVGTVSPDKVIVKKTTKKFVTNALVTKNRKKEMEDIYAARGKKLKENVRMIGSVNRALLSSWVNYAKGDGEELDSHLGDGSNEERDVLPPGSRYYKAATKSSVKVRQSPVAHPTYRDTPISSQRVTRKLSPSLGYSPDKEERPKVGKQIRKMTISKNAMWHKTQTMKKKSKNVKTPLGKMFQEVASSKLEE
jgi:hypothetical protein